MHVYINASGCDSPVLRTPSESTKIDNLLIMNTSGLTLISQMEFVVRLGARTRCGRVFEFHRSSMNFGEDRIDPCKWVPISKSAFAMRCGPRTETMVGEEAGDSVVELETGRPQDPYLWRHACPLGRMKSGTTYQSRVGPTA